MISSINRTILPLAQDNGAFLEVAPNLFGPDFSTRAKEHLEQVKSLKAATLPARHNIPHGSNRQGSVFRSGLPSGRPQTIQPETSFRGEKPPSELKLHTFLCKNCFPSYSFNTQWDYSQEHCTHSNPIKPSWSVGSFHGQLADFNKGPVGPKYNNRVRD